MNGRWRFFLRVPFGNSPLHSLKNPLTDAQRFANADATTCALSVAKKFFAISMIFACPNIQRYVCRTKYYSVRPDVKYL